MVIFLVTDLKILHRHHILLHIVQSLNFEVLCIDNLFRGKKANLHKIADENKFHFFDIDLNNNDSIF